MAPPTASYTPYNPAAHGPPSALLPEEVFGHVDVATLEDITRYLRESESQDDTELATWIQRNYLHGLRKDKSTATIRTPEGFAQLDRAYRRVRSLTNKAQDKWPFFDRNFKQMSTATVRNNARGEAAPGVSFNKDGMRRSSGLGEQPQASFNHNASPGPQLQAPFGDRNPGKFQTRKQQEVPRPARQTPVPLPHQPLPHQLPPKVAERLDSGKRSVPPELPQYQDFFSGSDRQSMPLSGAPRYSSSLSMLSPSAEPEASQETSGASVSGDPNMDSARDAGGGKVRGGNGRFLPKDNPPVLSPKSKKAGKKRRERARMVKVKEAEKRKSATRSIVSEEQEPEQEPEPEPGQEPEQTESPTSVQDEDVFADVQSPSPSIPGDTIEVHNAVESSQEPDEPAQQDTMDFIANGDTEPNVPSEDIHGHLSDSFYDTTAEPTPAYLAAEADPVPSNLDRLPPNSRRVSKRKSEPISHAAEPIKKRRVGRPKKSEQLEQAETQSIEEVPQMTTRRTTRQSAAATVQETPKDMPEAQPTVVQARDDKIEDDAAAEKEAEFHARTSSPHDHEDVVMGEVEEDATVGQEEDTTAGQEADATATGSQEEKEARAPAPTGSASKLRAPSATPSSITPAASTPPSTKKIAPQISDDDLLNIGLRKTSSPTPQRIAPYVSPYQPVPPPNFTANMDGQNAKPNGNIPNGTNIPPAVQATQPTPVITNGAAPTGHAPGHVEYFARITTGSGMMEVPIAPEQLNGDEEKMIRKYAEWNAQPNAVPVPYAQFRQIFSFAIKQ